MLFYYCYFLIEKGNTLKKRLRIPASKCYRLLWMLGIALLVTFGSFVRLSPNAYADDEVDSPAASEVCLAPGYRFHVGETQLEMTAGHCIGGEQNNPYWWQYSEGIDGLLRVVPNQQDNIFNFNASDGSSYHFAPDRVATWDNITTGKSICSVEGPSGSRCGQVLRTDYTPSYVPRHTASFMLVDASCQEGDSGAVWIDGVTAIGVTSGYVKDTGQCIVTPMPAILQATGLGDTLQFNGVSSPCNGKGTGPFGGC